MERQHLKKQLVPLSIASVVGLVMCCAGVLALVAGYIGSKAATGRFKPGLANWPAWCLWSAGAGLVCALAGLGLAHAGNRRMRRILIQARAEKTDCGRALAR
jgi:hypothetical protein